MIHIHLIPLLFAICGAAFAGYWRGRRVEAEMWKRKDRRAAIDRMARAAEDSGDYDKFIVPEYGEPRSTEKPK